MSQQLEEPAISQGSAVVHPSAGVRWDPSNPAGLEESQSSGPCEDAACGARPVGRWAPTLAGSRAAPPATHRDAATRWRRGSFRGTGDTGAGRGERSHEVPEPIDMS